MQVIAHVFAAGAETAGKNIGDIIKVIGSYVLLGIVGWVLMGLIPGRKVGQMVGIIIVAFVIGGFFVAGDDIWNIIEGTWQRIARGT